MINWDRIPESQSILILANYRVGSTALGDVISTKRNVINLGESFHPEIKGQYDIKNGRKKLIKVMPDHVRNIPPDTWDWMLKEFYVLGITRRCFPDQLVSFYISHQTSVWSQMADNSSIGVVAIDNNKIIDVARYLQKLNVLQDTMKHLCDQWLTYEDIRSGLELSRYKKHMPPDNIEELKKAVDHVLKTTKW